MPYATNADVRIHYHLDGNADGPPLVLLHGFGMSLHDWSDAGYVAALGEGYRLILVDARGHGRSDKPHDLDAYRMARMAGDVVAVLDDLGLTQAHFLGYSMGGNIGFGLAEEAPARLHSLILGGASGRDRDPEGPDSRGHLDRLAQGMAVWASGLQAAFGPWGTPALGERAHQNDVEALIAYMSVAERYQYAETLPRVTAPCLVFCGDGDAPHARAQAIAASMPNARFLSLPGLNHLTAYCRTDVVLPPIIAFLEEVSSPEGFRWVVP